MAASYKVEETVAVDLGALLDARVGAIVTLTAGETQLVAHRAVLATRSPVFAAMFQHDTLEASSGEVDITDVEGPVLRQLVAYIYTLQPPQLPSMAADLLAAADKYSLSGLKDACEQEVVSQLSVENAASAAVLALSHSCSSLKEAAVAFIKAHTHQVMMTQGWADALFSHPQSVLELTRLIAEPPAQTSGPATAGGSPTHGTPCQPHSDHGTQTPATRAPPAAHCHTPPPDTATISHMRGLSAEESARRLFKAAKEGEVQPLRALLVVGADVGARDEDGWTALQFAADSGHVEAVRCLLGAGADVDTRNGWQETPLHRAAVRGHEAVVRLLLAASADPSARDEDGTTPLHLAAANGKAEVAAALLEGGADRWATDEEGKIPLDLARRYNRRQLLELLTQ